MIKASVIIPTYKRPDETKHCLDLICRSKGINKDYLLEVIVIDSSPDKTTFNKLKSFRSTLEFKYYHLAQQTLPGKARNFGVQKANYELIISMDSDIEVADNTVPLIISYMRDHPKVARMTGKSIFSSGDKKGEIDRPTKWDRIHKANNTDYIEGIYGRYECFYRSAFLSVQGYDEIFEYCGEGTDISIKFWRKGFPLAFSDKMIAYHNSDAPGSLRRATPDRIAKMYLSLFLIAYKYGSDDIELGKSKNFINSQKERQAVYGDTLEFRSIVSAAKSFEWIAKNISLIKKSKDEIPNKYDFKPFEIFSEKTMLDKCIRNAEKEISSYYKSVFG